MDRILQQEIQYNLILCNYTTIIIDKAHKRDLNTDVIMGLKSVVLTL